MHVCLEATSLIGARSGVGHTTAALARALVDVDPDVEVTLFPISARGGGRLRRSAPTHPRIRTLGARIPARLASWMWARAEWPPVELFSGSADVFHGPNFLLPPTLKAAGVVTVHDLAFDRMPEAVSDHVRTYATTVPVACRRANRIIVPSSFVAGELAAWLPDEADRIRVVHPGVREAFTAAGGPLTGPRAEALGVREPYVAFVGNLETRKNLDALLEAFDAARSKVPDARLVLVGGPGVGWEEIRRRHEALLASDAVVVTGYLPDTEVAAVVRGARAFVYPSRYEGFGMPPLEALACGTPVIAAETTSLPEALGGHATFVSPDDTPALAEAVLDALRGDPDPGLLDAGRAWASAFTWERTATAALDVYREAVEEVRS